MLTRVLSKLVLSSVADLRGGREGRAAPPSSGPKFLHFHAVFRKNWPNNRLAPPPFWVSAPSSGKSWIRHWSLFNKCNSTCGLPSSIDKTMCWKLWGLEHYHDISWHNFSVFILSTSCIPYAIPSYVNTKDFRANSFLLFPPPPPPPHPPTQPFNEVSVAWFWSRLSRIWWVIVFMVDIL